jgi:hypothetical protein
MTEEEALTYEFITPFIMFGIIGMAHVIHYLSSISKNTCSPANDNNNEHANERQYHLIATPTTSCWLSCVQRLRYSSSAYKRSYVSMYLFTYSAVAALCLEVLRCTNIPTVSVSVSYNVMLSRPAISCDSNYYRTIYPISLTLIIVYIIALPLLIIIRMFQLRQQLIAASQQHQHNNNNNNAAHTNVSVGWLVLIEDYHSRHGITMIWSLIIVGRRAALAFTDLIEPASVQSFVTGLLVAIILLSHLYIQVGTLLFVPFSHFLFSS